MFLQGQFLSLVGATTKCTLPDDPICVAIPATPFCNVDAEICTKADTKNADCKTAATGMSVTLGSECVADCKNVKTPTPPTTVNVGGFHDVAGVCTEDTPASTTDNNACMPVKAKFSVNADK